jgi:hypothetical protein
MSAAGRRRPTAVPPWLFAAVVAAAVLAAVTIGLFGGVRHDDAYISYRYAQNLATGHGLVFNPGERLMGSTSPGHVLVAALAYPLAGKDGLPAVMAALGCLGWTAQAIAAGLLVRSALGGAGAVFVAACVGLGAARPWSWVALETNESAALCLFAIVAASRKRWTAAAILAALAGLARPDTYALAAVLGALAVRDLGRRALRPALLFAAASAPWYLFAVAYFGSPLPHSAVAKYGLVSAARYAKHLAEHLPGAVLPVPAGAPLVLLVAALAVTGAVRLAKADRALLALPAWLALHAAAYVALRPHTGQTWHQYPAVLVVAILALTGLVVGAGALARFVRVPARARPVIGAALGLVVALGYARQAIAAADAYPTEYWLGARDVVYRRVAEHLATRAAPGDVFTGPEVGTVAYLTDLAANDLSGIVSRTIDADMDLERLAETRRRWVLLPTCAGRAGVLFREGTYCARLWDLTLGPAE